jgi:hypothetical protein
VVVHPRFAAFVDRLQSALSLARRCLIAAQQRQKAFADQRRLEKVYKVWHKVLLSTKYLTTKAQRNESQAPPQMDWSI